MHAAITRGITALAVTYGRRKLALTALRRYLRDGWATELWRSRATKAYVPRAPVTLEVQLTNVCQRHCPRCGAPHPSIGGRPGFMSPDTFGRLVSQLRQLRLRDLRLGGDGDPLRHPDLTPWLPHLRDLASLRTLTTPGHHLTPLIAAELLRSVDVVEVAVARTGGGDELLANLASFRALRRRMHARTLLHVRILLQPCDVPDVDDLLAFWRRHCDAVSTEYVADEFDEDDDVAGGGLPTVAVCWDGDIMVNGLVVAHLADTRHAELWRSSWQRDYPERARKSSPADAVCHYCLDPQQPAVRKVLEAIAQQRSRREPPIARELETVATAEWSRVR